MEVPRSSYQSPECPSASAFRASKTPSTAKAEHCLPRPEGGKVLTRVAAWAGAVNEYRRCEGGDGHDDSDARSPSFTVRLPSIGCREANRALTTN